MRRSTARVGVHLVGILNCLRSRGHCHSYGGGRRDYWKLSWLSVGYIAILLEQHCIWLGTPMRKHFVSCLTAAIPPRTPHLRWQQGLCCFSVDMQLQCSCASNTMVLVPCISINCPVFVYGPKGLLQHRLELLICQKSSSICHSGPYSNSVLP